MNRDTVIGRLPLMGENQPGIAAEGCINLRRAERSDALELVPAAAAAGEDAAGVFATVGHPCGKLEFSVSATGTVSVHNTATGTTARVGTLSGRLISAHALGIGRVAVSTGAGGEMILIADDGTCRLATRGDLFAPLRFEVYSEMELTAKVAARNLKETYDGRSVALSEADAAQLADDLLQAYRKLAYSAGASGLGMQPVLARYRLEGRGGELLFRSAPVVVMPAGGFQCMEEMSAKLSDDGRRREAFAVQALTWRMRLISAENRVVTASDEVERLVVEATMPIHPVQFGGVQWTALAADGSSGTRLRFFIPGCSVTMAKATKRVAERLRQVYIHGEGAFHDVAEVKRPFDGSGSLAVDFAPYGAGFQSAKEQTAAIDRLIAADVAPRNAILARCRPPHRFYAAACDRVGEHVVWANVTARRFQGYPLEQFALIAAAGTDWRASVTVTMADGEERAAVGSAGSNGAPLKLSPLLSYPSADAVAMTVSIERGDERFKSTFPLTPAPDGLSAYYFDPQCRLIEPSPADDEFSFGIHSGGERTFACAAVSAPVADCFNPTDASEASDGEIVAVRSVERRAGGWDFSQRRVYLFSRAGTQLGRLDSAGFWTSFNPFDSRAVESAGAVASTTDDRFPLVFIAGGDLLGLTSTSLVTLITGIEGHSLRWAADGSGLHIAGDGASEAVMRHPGGGYYLTTGALAGMTPFEYRLTVDVPRRSGTMIPPRLRAVAADLKAAQISGTMSVEGDGQLISKFSFSGAIDRHLALRVVSFGCSEITVRISGMAAGQAELRSLRLLWS